MYTTNSPEACQYVVGNCEANVVVVQNDAQLQKILKVWDQLPHLKAVIQYQGELKEKKDNVYTVSYSLLIQALGGLSYKFSFKSSLTLLPPQKKTYMKQHNDFSQKLPTTT